MAVEREDLQILQSTASGHEKTTGCHFDRPGGLSEANSTYRNRPLAISLQHPTATTNNHICGLDRVPIMHSHGRVPTIPHRSIHPVPLKVYSYSRAHRQ